jgi:DNA-binding NarL/FixJ family response regulator
MPPPLISNGGYAAARRRATEFPVSRDARGASRVKSEGMTERCLIVDDSRQFIDAARGLLERQGLRVVGVATNGSDAMQLAQQLQPDVTLLDIDLGGESGFVVAQQLQRHVSSLPVILISTHAEEDYRDMIAASPALGFLSKTDLSAAAIRDLLQTV